MVLKGGVLRDLDLHIIKDLKARLCNQKALSDPHDRAQDGCGNDASATEGFVCDLLELPSKVWIETRRCYETCVSF